MEAGGGDLGLQLTPVAGEFLDQSVLELVFSGAGLSFCILISATFSLGTEIITSTVLGFWLRIKTMVGDATVAFSASTCCVRGGGMDVERPLVGDGGVEAETVMALAVASASCLSRSSSLAVASEFSASCLSRSSSSLKVYGLVLSGELLELLFPILSASDLPSSSVLVFSETMLAGVCKYRRYLRTP